MQNIRIGAEVRLIDGNFTLVSVHGGRLKLRNLDTSEYIVIAISELPLLLAEPIEGLLRENVLEPRSLEIITPAQRSEIETLAAHLDEMLYGTPLPWTGEIREEYDVTRTASARLRSKSAELTAGGMQMSEITLKRKKARYNELGQAGLVDKRQVSKPAPLHRADPRLVEALRAVVRETNSSTGTIDGLEVKLRNELLKRFPDELVEIPNRTTLWRYVKHVSKGKYTLGNAANRRSKANAPDRMFDSRPAIMPGHEVQIDSSPFDIMVLDERGKPQRAVLTIMMDKATRSIIATSVVLKASKGVDHALLLAKCLVPRPLRPGGEHFAHYELPQMPWAKLLEPEDVGRFDTAQPFIIPQRIITDNGADYVSNVFRSACAQLEIDLTESSTYSPTDKAIVERTFGSIKTMLAQHLPGFSGGSVDRRGKDPSKDAGLLDIYTLTELFDRWVTIVWQNRPHDSLQDPLDRTVIHSPNSMYMAMFDLVGFVPVPLTANDYISLMPIKWRRILSDGVQLDYRRYDSPLLAPYRDERSGDASQDGKWAVRYDPYNPSAVWVMDIESGEWIECKWMNSDAFKKPFSRHIRTEARRIVEEMGMTGDKDSLTLTLDILASTKAAKAQMEGEEERNRIATRRNQLSGLPSPSAPSTSVNLAPEAMSDEDDDDGFDILGTVANGGAR